MSSRRVATWTLVVAAGAVARAAPPPAWPTRPAPSTPGGSTAASAVARAAPPAWPTRPAPSTPAAAALAPSVTSPRREAAAHFSLPPLPPQLSSTWLSPKASKPACGAHATNSTIITVFGGYGRQNNAFTLFANLLLLAANHPDRPAVALPAHLLQHAPEHAFDYPAIVSALSSWVCVVREIRGGGFGAAFVGPDGGAVTVGRVERVLAKDAFRWLPHASTLQEGWPEELLGVPRPPNYEELRGHVIAQIVLRPSPALRKIVDAFAADHDLAAGYVAIHGRSTQLPNCFSQPGVLNSTQRLRTEDLLRDQSRPLDADDIRHMSDDYIDAALSRDHVPRAWAVVLVAEPPKGGDKHSLGFARGPAIRRRYGALSYAGGAHYLGRSGDLQQLGGLVDWLLLANSSYLIGNPCSTFSANAHRVRRAFGAAPETTNLS